MRFKLEPVRLPNDPFWNGFVRGYLWWVQAAAIVVASGVSMVFTARRGEWIIFSLLGVTAVLAGIFTVVLYKYGPRPIWRRPI